MKDFKYNSIGGKPSVYKKKAPENRPLIQGKGLQEEEKNQDEIPQLERARQREFSDNEPYNNNDFIYSIFCCKCGDKRREGKYLKYLQKKDDIAEFNADRDLSTFIVTLEHLENKVEGLEKKAD